MLHFFFPQNFSWGLGRGNVILLKKLVKNFFRYLDHDYLTAAYSDPKYRLMNRCPILSQLRLEGTENNIVQIQDINHQQTLALQEAVVQPGLD